MMTINSTRLTFKVDLGMLMDAIRESMPAVCAKIGDEMDGDSSESRPTTSGASDERDTCC